MHYNRIYGAYGAILVIGAISMHDYIEQDKQVLIRKNIIDSWERCRTLGLLPEDMHRILQINSTELNSILKENEELMNIALPYIEKMRTILHHSDFFIGLCNNENVIFYSDCKSNQFNELGWQTGCILSETNIGNNALGTCILTGEPTIVMGHEHYLETLHHCTEYAVPIHNVENDVIASLAIVLFDDTASEGFLTMLIMVGHGIEKELFQKIKNNQLTNITEILSEYNEGIINNASILSHEIRNSLSVISAYVQLLQLEQSLTPDKGDRILKEITRVNKLLEDFKRLTKPVRFGFANSSMQDILISVIESMSPKAIVRHIAIELETPQESIGEIPVDKDAIKQVFINLIENAIQAMEDGGLLNIRLYLRHNPSVMVIEFKDNGAGIPEDQISNIFNIFYTTKKTGNGLGLSLCTSIIKGHGGQIYANSIPGEGSTFTIELPFKSKK